MKSVETTSRLSSGWLLLDDFDLQSRSPGTCSVTNLPKRPADVGIFRPYFDHAFIVEEGYFDVTQVAIEEAATMLGWISPVAHEAALAYLNDRVQSQQTRIMHDGRKIARLEAKIQRMMGTDEAE